MSESDHLKRARWVRVLAVAPLCLQQASWTAPAGEACIERRVSQHYDALACGPIRRTQLEAERAAALRRKKSMSMIKLRAVSKLSGMQLHVSKVKKVPVTVHEEFEIEGTDRGVLKRIATEKSLQVEVRMLTMYSQAPACEPPVPQCDVRVRCCCAVCAAASQGGGGEGGGV